MIALEVTRDENETLDITVSTDGSFAEIIDEIIAGATSVVRAAGGGSIIYVCMEQS